MRRDELLITQKALDKAYGEQNQIPRLINLYLSMWLEF